MKRHYHYSQVLAWTAVLGVVAPARIAVAVEPASDSIDNHHAVIQDAELAKSGVLRGRVFNAQGVAISGVDVAVLADDGSTVLSRTTEQGEFAVGGLKGGVYQVVAGQGCQVIRAWTEGTAPPAAEQQIMIVSDPSVVVGQYEPGTFGYFLQEAKYTLGNPLVVGGIIAAAVAIPVAIHNADDDESTGS
jgi:hypothetical protein